MRLGEFLSPLAIACSYGLYNDFGMGFGRVDEGHGSVCSATGAMSAILYT